MVLLLPIDVFQHRCELTWADGKHSVSALPKESAILGVTRLDPLRRGLLNVLNYRGLRQRARERRNDMNMISHSVCMDEFRAEIAANRGEISVDSRAQIAVQPWFAILRAKDDMEKNC